MKRNKAILVVALSLVLLAVAAPSHAVPMLRLTADGTTSVTITDQVVGVGGDANPLVGAITFVGTVGIFDINMTTALTKPILGSAGSPSMVLTSSDSSTTAVGSHSLVVEFSEIGFGPVNSSFRLGMTGGTSIGTDVLYEAFLDTANGNFPTATALGSVGPLIGPAFSGSATSSQIALAGPFSLNERVTINITGPASTTFNATLAVPEPGLLLLLGTGLLTVGFLGSRLNG